VPISRDLFSGLHSGTLGRFAEGFAEGFIAACQAVMDTSENSTSNIQHPTSNIQHPTSNIQHPTSNIQHPTSTIQHPTFPDWPAELPAQVAALRKLLPTIGHDPEALAACFGRKSKKRVDQITAILDTLKALGLID